MARLFFLISGENPTLPFSEVKSILEAEGYKYEVLGELTQAIRIEADQECVESVKFRSALAKNCCLEIFICQASLEKIISNVRKVDFTRFLEDNEAFVVRIVRVRGFSKDISRSMLEREIGEIILENVRTKNVKVDLKNPNKTFFGLFTDKLFLFGLKLADVKHKDLFERNPGKRAFFHPAAINAKDARCMVNLARAKAGNMVLDPFCGTGGLLIEAGLIGCRVIGFDIDRYMINGCRKNLNFFGIEPEGLGVADVCWPPLKNMSIDHIVTDPPYGTASSTFGFSTKSLVEKFFSVAADILKHGGVICISAPKIVKLSEIGVKYGFKHLESHLIYVHKRLTREIAVFKRIN